MDLPCDVYLEIRGSNGNEPSGTILGTSAVIRGKYIPTGNAYMEWKFNTPVALTGDHWFVFHLDTNNSTGWQYNINCGPTDNNYVVDSTDGTTWNTLSSTIGFNYWALY